jgi:hypothetical protein
MVVEREKREKRRLVKNFTSQVLLRRTHGGCAEEPRNGRFGIKHIPKLCFELLI